jgi:ABC-type phosphate transport system substrate-binding protein
MAGPTFSPTMKRLALIIGLACAALPAGTLRAAPIEGAVVIANPGVPADSITAAALKDIYDGKTRYWSGGLSMVIAVLPGETDAALKAVSGLDASQFKTFWQRLVFSGRGQQPKKADDAAALVALVASTKGAIALVPAETVLKDVKQLEVK